MKQARWYVIEVNNGYFMADYRNRKDGVVVFCGTWQECRQFIDPTY